MARRRVVRGAITITATVRAATGARNDSFVPAANPAAIPATASAAGAIAARAGRALPPGPKLPRSR